MNTQLALLLTLIGLALWPATSTGEDARPRASHAAVPTCAEYPDQAAAQRAADTRDPDGDGIYCESLPCPCSSVSPGDDSGHTGGDTPQPRRDGCSRPRRVQRLVFDARRYPHVRRHVRRAIRRGWPRVLVLNRRGADARRDRLLARYPVRESYDLDEYPPAVGRGRGPGLERGREPRGWKADVRYVPSSENRSHGALLGARLSDYCDGTRFRYVFR